MDTYLILRRGAWETFQEVEASAQRSKEIGSHMTDKVSWIRSYVIEEDDGRMGTACVYQATSPSSVQEHAMAADLPADEILRVKGTVILKEDPPE